MIPLLLLESDSFTIRLDWHLITNVMVGYSSVKLLALAAKWLLSKVKT